MVKRRIDGVPQVDSGAADDQHYLEKQLQALEIIAGTGRGSLERLGILGIDRRRLIEYLDGDASLDPVQRQRFEAARLALDERVERLRQAVAEDVEHFAGGTGTEGSEPDVVEMTDFD